MLVYIEDLLIDNLVINFIILFLCKKIVREEGTLRVILSDILGTLSTIVFTLWNFTGIYLLLFKFCIANLMVLTAFKYKTFKRYLFNYFSFIFITAVLGGVTFLISFTFGKEVDINGIITYNLSLPMGIIFLIIFIFSIIIYKLFSALKNRYKISEFLFSVKLKENNKEILIKGFLDTGNTLIDSSSGKPVFILTYNNFKKIYDISLEKLITNKFDNKLKNAHYIGASSINNSSKMLVFNMDELIIKIKNDEIVIKNPAIGLSFKNLEKNLNCGMLLNSSVLSEGKI